MGTRGLTCVMKDGKYKIAQYGQWDHYPDGQGKDCINFLSKVDLNKFKESLKKVRFITKKENEKMIEDHTDKGSISYGSMNDLWWKNSAFSRDLGAEILEKVYFGKFTRLRNEISFVKDSLWCEFCYVIDLDKGTFEIYKGFNKEKLSKEARFYSAKPDKDGYYPVKLLKEYKLKTLPTEKEFLKEMNKLLEDDDE